MITNAQFEAQRQRDHEKEVKRDINEIKNAINDYSSTDLNVLIQLHKRLDIKYRTSIIDWHNGLQGYVEGIGFAYEEFDDSTIGVLAENLATMQSKLEAFKLRWNAKQSSDNYAKSPEIKVLQENNISLNISISFEEVRQRIDDMSDLDSEQKEEAKRKIDELETISKEPISRKSKWEKVKPIIAFVMDKGADVAVAILGIIVQMKLGG